MAAMYTKMTSTGSSLIVNPRTISKELEARITASIAAVVAKHDAAKLTTKLVRQAVEKDVHVSLANHKELLKRLMHQEFRKLKAAKVAKRVAPVAWKSAARRDAVRRGLNRVFVMLRDDSALFTDLGMHAMQTLYDLQAVETGDTQQLATLYARLLGALWLKSEQLASHYAVWSPASTPSAEQVVDTLKTLFVIERLGNSFSKRVEVLEFFSRPSPVYTAADYFGWDPAAGPPVSDDAGSAFLKMANALMGVYYARFVNVSLGCTLEQLAQHLPSFYPFKSPAELSAVDYRDQLLLVTTTVTVLTKFGTLLCEPELLPHEYFFLRHHLVYHLAQQDIVLTSETLRALKCFDGSENLVQVRRGMAFLLFAQQKDGTWDNAVESDAVRSYFSTLQAAMALSETKPVGFAPSVPELAPMLETHVNADVGAFITEPEASGQPKQSQAAPPSAAADEKMDTGASQEDLQTQVLFLQGMLEKDGGNVKSVSATLATHVVNTLAGLALTVEILKTTGVGRVINKLRKHAAPHVAKSATQLVAKWKKDLL